MDGSDRTEILLFVTSKGLDAGVCENALVGRVDDFIWKLVGRRIILTSSEKSERRMPSVRE